MGNTLEKFTSIRKVCMNLLRSAKAYKKTLNSTSCKVLMFHQFAFYLVHQSGLRELDSLTYFALRRRWRSMDFCEIIW